MKESTDGVLVTGASSGIGRAIACELASRGRRIFLTGRDSIRLQEVAAECGRRSGSERTIPHAAFDLMEPTSSELLIRQAEAETGPLGLFVHAAGIGFFGPPEVHDEDVLKHLLEINFFAATRLTRALLPRFRERGRGHLVYILSVAAKRPFPGTSGYTASKFALRGYAEAIRQDLRGVGVAITCAHPVATRTAFWERAGYDNWEATHTRTRIYDADDIARRLVERLGDRPREWFPDFRSHLLDFGQRIAPRLLEWITARGAPTVRPRFSTRLDHPLAPPR